MLSPIATPYRRQRFKVYDLEWVPGKLDLRCVDCFDGSGHNTYYTIADFLDNQLTKENNGKWFYAHAGGLADFQFVLEELVKNGSYQCEGSFSGSSCIIAKIIKGRQAWYFVDSYWLLRAPLAKIGKWLGNEKTGPTDDMSDEERKNWYATVDIETLVKYCRQDTEILWYAIDGFQNNLIEYGGELQKTIASSAMRLFRRKYLSQKIVTCDTLNELSREAYHASRVEVFSTKCDDGYYYDINSSFPYAMTKPAPGNLLKSYKYLPNSLSQDYIERPFFVRAEIEVPDCYIPPVPTKIQGRVFFPVGRWTSWLTGVDLNLLLAEGGKIHKIYEVKEFEPFYDLADYAQDIYKRRLEEKDPYKKVVLKFLLNSAYGKFAETTEKQTMYLDPSKETLENLNHDQMLCPGIWVEDRIVDVEHEHVPIAAHITALARKTLFDFMSCSNEFYYCDTDGFSTANTYGTGSELGGLKLEKKIEQGHFVVPKVYSIEGEVLQNDGRWEKERMVKAKGFSLSKGEKGERQFDDLVAGLEIKVERMRRIRENINMAKRGMGSMAPCEDVITKGLSDNVFPKRFHYPDGATRPWSLNEINCALGA